MRVVFLSIAVIGLSMVLLACGAGSQTDGSAPTQDDSDVDSDLPVTTTIRVVDELGNEVGRLGVATEQVPSIEGLVRIDDPERGEDGEGDEGGGSFFQVTATLAITSPHPVPDAVHGWVGSDLDAPCTFVPLTSVGHPNVDVTISGPNGYSAQVTTSSSAGLEGYFTASLPEAGAYSIAVSSGTLPPNTIASCDSDGSPLGTVSFLHVAGASESASFGYR